MDALSFRGCRWIALATLAAAVVAEIAALTGEGTAPHTVLAGVLASPVGMSAVVIFLLAADSAERTIVVRAMIGVAIATFVVLFALGFATFDATLIASAAIPTTVFGYLLFQIAQSSGDRRGAAIDLLAATSIIGVSALSMIFCLNLSTTYFNPIFDADYIRMDGLFGAQPSAVVAVFFAYVPPLSWLCMAVYVLLPLAQSVVAVAEARAGRQPTLGILPGFIIAAVIGYVLYALMPAIGPLPYLGADFPALHVDPAYLASRSTMDDEHIRGAMPSLHITWAALLYLACRRMRGYAQAAAASFLVLTFLATLGLGMHYLIDLIVAAPLIILVRALCAVDMPWQQPEKIVAVAGSAALLGGWVVITRAGINIEANAVILLTAMAVTVIVPLVTNRWLDRADASRHPAPEPTPITA